MSNCEGALLLVFLTSILLRLGSLSQNKKQTLVVCFFYLSYLVPEIACFGRNAHYKHTCFIAVRIIYVTCVFFYQI